MSDPRLRATAILGVAWAVLPALLGFVLLANIGMVGDWLRQDLVAGAAAYVLLFALTSGLGLLPTYAQAVVGGWVFGLVGGIPLALAGFAGGAMIGFLVTRLIGRDALRDRIARHPKASAISAALIGRGPWRTLGVVALLRFPPNSPFALTNLVMAGAGVRVVPFVVGTVIGMLPRTAVMIGIGAAGAASGARDIQELVTTRHPLIVIGGIASAIVVLLILAAIGQRAVRGLDAPTSPADRPQ